MCGRVGVFRGICPGQWLSGWYLRVPFKWQQKSLNTSVLSQNFALCATVGRGLDRQTKPDQIQMMNNAEQQQQQQHREERVRAAETQLSKRAKGTGKLRVCAR